MQAQRLLHLREKQKAPRNVPTCRRGMARAGNPFVESDDERLHRSEEAEGRPMIPLRKRERLRSSLPVVSCHNKSLERPLGMAFLTFHNETKRGTLPNEITSMSTIWALFVRAFPDQLTMEWFETAEGCTICILSRATNAYQPLTDLRDVVNQCALLVLPFDPRDVPPVVSCTSSPRSTTVTFYKNNLTSSTNKDDSRFIRKEIQAPGSPQSLKPCAPADRRQALAYGSGDWKRNNCNPEFFHFTGRGSNSSDLLPYSKALQKIPRNQIPSNRPRTSSDSSTSSVQMDRLTRDRLETVETQLASLRNMVQNAMMHDLETHRHQHQHQHRSQQQQQQQPKPHLQQSSSSLSTNSDISQVTVKSPGCCRKKMDLKQSLAGLQRQAKALQKDVHQLRKRQVDNLSWLQESNTEAMQKIQIAIVVMMQSLRCQREAISSEKGRHIADITSSEVKLRSLEEAVEELRKRIINQRSDITVHEIDQLVLILTQINKSLTSIRGKFRILQEDIGSFVENGSESVEEYEKFLEEETIRLEKMFSRCRHLTGALTILKKVAVVHRSPDAKSYEPKPLATMNNSEIVNHDKTPSVEEERVPESKNRAFDRDSCNVSNRGTKMKLSDQPCVTVEDEAESCVSAKDVADQSCMTTQDPATDFSLASIESSFYKERHVPEIQQISQNRTSLPSRIVAPLHASSNFNSTRTQAPSISHRNNKSSSSSSSSSSASSVTSPAPNSSDYSPSEPIASSSATIALKRVIPEPPVRRFTQMPQKQAQKFSQWELRPRPSTDSGANKNGKPSDS